ncbi:hypothetical protein BH23GEM10_BH23GEM10_06470 [soil metagenome]
MDANLLHQGAAAAMELARAANGFVDARAPWAAAKDPARASELDDTLAALARAVVVLTSLLQPFMPSKAADLAGRLGLDGVLPFAELAGLDMTGRNASRGEVLFPKERSAAHA